MYCLRLINVIYKRFLWLIFFCKWEKLDLKSGFQIAICDSKYFLCMGLIMSILLWMVLNKRLWMINQFSNMISKPLLWLIFFMLAYNYQIIVEKGIRLYSWSLFWKKLFYKRGAVSILYNSMIMLWDILYTVIFHDRSKLWANTPVLLVCGLCVVVWSIYCRTLVRILGNSHDVGWVWILGLNEERILSQGKLWCVLHVDASGNLR